MIYVPRQARIRTTPPSVPVLDVMHPLASKAEAFLPTGLLTTPYGSPTRADTAKGPLVGGVTSALVLTGVRPLFAAYDGDFTVTFIAMSMDPTLKSIIGGYVYGYRSPDYGALQIAMHRRVDGDYLQRGAFNVSFMPTRSTYQAPTSVGFEYEVSPITDPFYETGTPRCVSVACIANSESDFSCAVDGAVYTNSKLKRINTLPAMTGISSRSGIGFGGAFNHGLNAVTEGNNNMLGLVILHRRKLTVFEQCSLTANPWQVFL